MRRVAVTGLGIVSPFGRGRRVFFDSIAAGLGGLKPVTRFDTAGLPAHWAGEVPRTDELIKELTDSYGCVSGTGGLSLEQTLDRDIKIAFALAAAEEAVEEAGLKSFDRKTLIHLGVSLETFSLAAVGSIKGLDPLATQKLMVGASLRIPLDRAVSLIEARYGRAGLSLTNCSACAAGLEALGQAYRAVAGGEFELAVAGAFDSLINPLGLGGFYLLGALAEGEPEEPWPLCRPFDVQRRGLVMGEGAAVMVLEPLEKARACGRKIYGEILSYGASLDAYSLSAPDPAGSGAFRAMEAALSAAKLSPLEVDHLNAHGTGTVLNDPIEAGAVRRLFPNWPQLPVAAVKSMTGHAIAAAGALEAAACLFAFERNLIPPNVGLETAGPGCELFHVQDIGQPFSGSVILTNSFGFGGQNAAMTFRRVI